MHALLLPLIGLVLALPARAQDAPPVAASAPAAEAAPAPRAIVQQRLPDGSVIFTDRPQPGGRIERRWDYTPEDPAAAEARRATAQRESEAVAERLARQIEQQRERDRDIELARARAAQAEAERAAERARAEAEQPRIVTGPIYGYLPRPPVRPLRPPQLRPPPRQPGPVVPPRPGATPPPGPNKPPPAPYEIEYGR